MARRDTKKPKFVLDPIEKIVGKGDLFGFTLYQQYFSYLTATVYKSMFPGLFLTSTSPVHYSDPARVAQWRACQTHDLVAVSSIPG